MSFLPENPIPVRDFIEDVIPSLFAEVELDEAAQHIELKVGVVVQASPEVEDPGGEWTLHFVAGELGILDGRQEECDLTVVQRVADWRAPIWEGHPRLIADGVDQLRTGGMEAMRPPGAEASADPLRGLSDLKGLIEIVIGEEVSAADWRVGILVGAGPLPESPQATIRLGAEQAEAIRTGDLHPVEALITGQLQLEGDLGLILQLQAVAMTLSMTAGGR